MNCISPPELEASQLLAYLDGEADPQTASHLEQCEYCRGKANALDRLQDRLTSHLYRITCPSSLELGEYQLHILPASQMLIVAQHVRECPHCERELDQLQDFLGELMPTPAGGLLGKAKVLIARLISSEAGPGSPWAVPALRGEAKGPLVFEADGIVITLDVQTGSNKQASIQGQVAADDQDQWTGAVVRLQQAGTPVLTASLDDLGAFAFEAVPPGSIDLKIASPNGVEVQIPNIDIAI
jgi:hypothetical protein